MSEVIALFGKQEEFILAFISETGFSVSLLCWAIYNNLLSKYI